MAITATLIGIFGKTAATGLLKHLGARKDGAAKLAEAATAIERGVSAVEALRQAFGKEFLESLNETLGTPKTAGFSYEAGTATYVAINGTGQPPAVRLRDELNINLDRLTLLELKSADLRNHCLGLMSRWKARCLESFGDEHAEDINSTYSVIETLLKGEGKDFRRVYRLISATGVGGVGALLLISGVLTAAGTGVGLVASISMFLYGIPWLNVGALVLSGSLLLALAATAPRMKDEISLSIALAYKLLERITSDDRSA